jgi:FRG domain
MALHSTWSGEIWLWRGQSQIKNGLEPAMHSRIRASGPTMDFIEENVQYATAQLLRIARSNGLDRIEELRLPDLALLAHLQHHGAATPLLDVTVDPFVGLWMVVHASGDDPMAEDDLDGVLFGIKRPEPVRWLVPLDSRPYWDDEGGADVATALIAGVHWYRPPPPDISERLRIQRGSFLVGPLQPGSRVTLPLKWEPNTRDVGWLKRRIDRIGHPGRSRQLRAPKWCAFKFPRQSSGRCERGSTIGLA